LRLNLRRHDHLRPASKKAAADNQKAKMMNRRTILTGFAALIAAPALVRAESLMPIKGDRYFFWEYRCPLLPDIGARWEAAYNSGVSFDEYAKSWTGPNGGYYEGTWTFFGKDRNIYSDQRVGFTKREMIYPLTRHSVIDASVGPRV
jgi:hypothetical protein